MAAALLEKYLKQAGKDYIEVRSAGVSALEGTPPTDETIEIMKKEGINVSGHEAKEATEDIIRNSDLILVMEQLHKDEVLRRVPEAASKTYLLKEFASQKKIEQDEMPGVPDPIGKPIEYYRYSCGIIKKEIERIVNLL